MRHTDHLVGKIILTEKGAEEITDVSVTGLYTYGDQQVGRYVHVRTASGSRYDSTMAALESLAEHRGNR